MNIQSERIDVLCQRLNLQGLAATHAALAQNAAKQESNYSDFLEQCLDEEDRSRRARTRQVLLKMAGFPEVKTLEDDDFTFAAGAPKNRSRRLPR